MNPSDPILADLVRQMAVMPQHQRQFILSSLSETECARLLPLLHPEEDYGLSESLSELVRRCATGTARELTRRAADELLAAVRLSRSEIGLGGDQSIRSQDGLWGRLAGRRRVGAP